MSVRDNVCFAVRGAPPDDDRLHLALEAAGAADLLADLPEGLDTPLGEGGRRLSGGQLLSLSLSLSLSLRLSLSLSLSLTLTLTR